MTLLIKSTDVLKSIRTQSERSVAYQRTSMAVMWQSTSLGSGGLGVRILAARTSAE